LFLTPGIFTTGGIKNTKLKETPQNLKQYCDKTKTKSKTKAVKARYK